MSDRRMFSGKLFLNACPDTEKPPYRGPLGCSTELWADADQQTGGYDSASTALQDLECILVRVHAGPTTQGPAIYTETVVV